MLEKLLTILENNNIFLTGGAGTGKSHLCMQVIHNYKKDGKKVAVLSSSALSALNIGGFTLHSFMGLGICSNLEELSEYDKNRKKQLKTIYNTIKKTDLLIIDEISLISAVIFDMVAFRLRMGGFNGRLLIVGDFCQLPPVIKEARVEMLGELYAFETTSWKDMKLSYVRLRTPKRSDDLVFYDHLRHLRFGVCGKGVLEYFKKLCVSEIEGNHTVLCATNKKANDINTQKLALLGGKAKSFKGISHKVDPSLSSKAMEGWISGISVNKELKLKVGAKVIFCINNKEEGYVNGEQGVVEGFDNKKGQIIIEKNGQTINLERFEYKLASPKDPESVRASFAQFPIKLAYAITMHKAQGMSIKKLIVDIDNVFENSQLYVAISRSSNPKELQIYYSRDEAFENYFKKILKFNEKVYDFYKNSEFIDLEGEPKIKNKKEKKGEN